MSILIIGCGYLGRRVAEIFQQAGRTVYATTRSEDRAASFADEHGWRPILWEITDSSGPKTPLPEIETVVLAVGFDRKSGHSIDQVYVGGVAQALNYLPDTVQRLFYVSSTGVYGQAQGELIDEKSPTNPTRPGGKACLQAEALLRESPFADRTTILRLAGIYGPGRLPYLQSIANNEPIQADGEGWLNLIHVEDAAAIIHQLDQLSETPPLLLVADGSPVMRKEYFAEIARQMNAPTPELVEAPPDHRRGGTGKRVDASLLRSTLSLELQFPTYREGVADILQDEQS